MSVVEYHLIGLDTVRSDSDVQRVAVKRGLACRFLRTVGLDRLHYVSTKFDVGCLLRAARVLIDTYHIFVAYLSLLQCMYGHVGIV